MNCGLDGQGSQTAFEIGQTDADFADGSYSPRKLLILMLSKSNIASRVGTRQMWAVFFASEFAGSGFRDLQRWQYREINFLDAVGIYMQMH
jgi:hypothetical protein